MSSETVTSPSVAAVDSVAEEASDSLAVELDEDLYLTALTYFDAVKLTITLDDDSVVVITLKNPDPNKEEQVKKEEK